MCTHPVVSIGTSLYRVPEGGARTVPKPVFFTHVTLYLQQYLVDLEDPGRLGWPTGRALPDTTQCSKISTDNFR
ncbi:hypothetical protein BDR07DRAFT_1443839 [Suillus spraguei]|nr:hypothetical protein BDR07DRAFT_1443839 [Suillus spraguei]